MAKRSCWSVKVTPLSGPGDDPAGGTVAPGKACSNRAVARSWSPRVPGETVGCAGRYLDRARERQGVYTFSPDKRAVHWPCHDWSVQSRTQSQVLKS